MATAGRPFLPGQSGNPNGRPRRGHAQADLMRAELAKAHRKGQTKAERLVEVYVNQALAGKIEAYRLLLERTEGAVARALALSGADGGPLTLDGTLEHRLTVERSEDDERVAAVLAYVAAQRGLLPGGE